MGVENTPLKNQEAKKTFETGAQKDTSANRGRYDLISHIFLRRLAIHLEKGAAKYASRNWEKGIPLRVLFTSMVRHAYQWIAGEVDEDHLAAVSCCIMFLMHTEKKIELGDLTKGLLVDLPDSYFLGRGYEGKPQETIDAEVAALKAMKETISNLATELLDRATPVDKGIAKAMSFVEKFGTSDPDEIQRLTKPKFVNPYETDPNRTILFDMGQADGREGIEPKATASEDYMQGFNSMGFPRLPQARQPIDEDTLMYSRGRNDQLDLQPAQYPTNEHYMAGYNKDVQ